MGAFNTSSNRLKEVALEARRLEFVYRVAYQSRWMAVAISVEGDSLQVGPPQELFEGPFVDRGANDDYDVTPDGSRLVVFQRQQEG